MFENIFETVVKGSSTIFLNVPENDYFLSYQDIDIEAAEEITGNYFTIKGKDGVPHVKDIDFDSSTHKVKITVDVEKSMNKKFDAANIPHAYSEERYQ